MVENLYDFKQYLEARGIFFSFCGPMSQNVMVEIGDALKQKLRKEEASASTILKVFSLVVEQSQNILYYSDEIVSDYSHKDELRLGILAVGLEQDRYYVMGGNLIENSKVPRLREKLEKIKSMSKDELKNYYKEKRRADGEEGSKGGGLGFIEMARKANDSFDFHFRKVNEEYSFFSMKTII